MHIMILSVLIYKYRIIALSILGFLPRMDVDDAIKSYNHLAMANLAATYRNQGQWKEAEALEMVVIQARRPMLVSL